MLAAAAIVPAALAGTSVAANASTTAPSQHGQHGQHERHGYRPQRLQPQTFIIPMNGNSNTNPVHAYGPIHGTGTDISKSDTLDVFTFRHGAVSVQHTSVANVQPKVNYRTCTATINASGTWKITAGTHAYRDARGQGTFRFNEFAKLARTSHGQCNLNANPVYATGKVVATGQASV